jgi:hypothetical protein
MILNESSFLIYFRQKQESLHNKFQIYTSQNWFMSTKPQFPLAVCLYSLILCMLLLKNINFLWPYDYISMHSMLLLHT